MSRYQKYSRIINTLLISKYSMPTLTSLPAIGNIEIQAGHFRIPKDSESTASRALLVSNLSSTPRPVIRWFTHGKKMKTTLTLVSTLSPNLLYWTLDKILNLLFPNLGDLKAMFPRNKNNNLNYYFRVNKPFELPEWESLFPVLSIRQLNYFPFFFKVSLKKNNFNSNAVNCFYLRMYRIPFQNPKWKN